MPWIWRRWPPGSAAFRPTELGVPPDERFFAELAEGGFILANPALAHLAAVVRKWAEEVALPELQAEWVNEVHRRARPRRHAATPLRRPRPGHRIRAPVTVGALAPAMGAATGCRGVTGSRHSRHRGHSPTALGGTPRDCRLYRDPCIGAKSGSDTGIALRGSSRF